jgi:hypothetical protein
MADTVGSGGGGGMIGSIETLVKTLRERDLISPSFAVTTPITDDANDRPWYITLLLGASGWLAGIFLLVFVGVLFFSHSGGGAKFIGLVLLAAAWGLFRADRNGAFVSQLALSFSIAGQFAVLFGVTEGHSQHGTTRIVFVALVLQIATLLLMPNRLHRIISAVFACAAWAMFVRSALWGDPFSWSYRATPSASPSLVLALSSWALAWAPVAIALYAAVTREQVWMSRNWQAVMRPLTTGLIAGLAWATLLSHPFESFGWRNPETGGVGWLALWPLLSVAASLVAMAAAFAMQSRALIGATLIAALLHVSHFYYAMGTSLIIKSIIMLAIGALLFFAARWLEKTGSPS